MFADEAQEYINLLFKKCSKTADGTHMVNRANSVGEILKTASNFENLWTQEKVTDSSVSGNDIY